MEGGGVPEKQTSYTYWVRDVRHVREDAAPLPVPRKLSAEDVSNQVAAGPARWPPLDVREDAAPLPVPRKLSAEDVSNQAPPNTMGSVWNQAGTWEERNLNSWASNRIKELLESLGTLEFCSGKAHIDDVSHCSGDAFLVTVRNKKRVGYTYELTLKFEGEWLIRNESKKIKGHLDIPEFSFGELDDLQVEVKLSEDKELEVEDKMQICKDLRKFSTPIRERLSKFEQELKDR